MVLEKTMQVAAMLNDAYQQLRPRKPELLHLQCDPALAHLTKSKSTNFRRLHQQHLHWDCFRLLWRDTADLGGDSLLDKEMSGLLGLHLFEQELYEIRQLTPVQCAPARPREAPAFALRP